MDEKTINRIINHIHANVNIFNNENAKYIMHFQNINAKGYYGIQWVDVVTKYIVADLSFETLKECYYYTKGLVAGLTLK